MKEDIILNQELHEFKELNGVITITGSGENMATIETLGTNSNLTINNCSLVEINCMCEGAVITLISTKTLEIKKLHANTKITADKGTIQIVDAVAAKDSSITLTERPPVNPFTFAYQSMSSGAIHFESLRPESMQIEGNILSQRGVISTIKPMGSPS